MIISLSGGISTVSTTDILLHLILPLRVKHGMVLPLTFKQLLRTEPVVVHKHTIAATIESDRVDEKKHVRMVGATSGSPEGVIPDHLTEVYDKGCEQLGDFQKEMSMNHNRFSTKISYPQRNTVGILLHHSPRYKYSSLLHKEFGRLDNSNRVIRKVIFKKKN
jgi:hypothetical protein